MGGGGYLLRKKKRFQISHFSPVRNYNFDTERKYKNMQSISNYYIFSF